MIRLKTFTAIGRRVVCRHCIDRIGRQREAFLAIAPEANGVSEYPQRGCSGRRHDDAHRNAEFLGPLS